MVGHLGFVHLSTCARDTRFRVKWPGAHGEVTCLSKWHGPTMSSAGGRQAWGRLTYLIGAGLSENSSQSGANPRDLGRKSGLPETGLDYRFARVF